MGTDITTLLASHIGCLLKAKQVIGQHVDLDRQKQEELTMSSW